MLEGIGFKPAMADSLPPASIWIIPCKYDCPVSVCCRVQGSNNRKMGPSTSMNKMCQPQISNMCLKIDRTVFIEHRCEKTPRSDP